MQISAVYRIIIVIIITAIMLLYFNHFCNKRNAGYFKYVILGAIVLMGALVIGIIVVDDWEGSSSGHIEYEAECGPNKITHKYIRVDGESSIWSDNNESKLTSSPVNRAASKIDSLNVNSMNTEISKVIEPDQPPAASFTCSMKGTEKLLHVNYNHNIHTYFVKKEDEPVMCDDNILIYGDGSVYSNGDRIDDIIKMCKLAGVKPKNYVDYASSHYRLIPIQDSGIKDISIQDIPVA